MKQPVEQALRRLVGLSLVSTNRAITMQMFRFGTPQTVSDSQGGTDWSAAYSLHLQSPWRIVGPRGIVTGSSDYFIPAGDPTYGLEPPDFAWDKPGGSRC